MRECIYSRHDYPDMKSRLRTYFLKMIRFYPGETWIHVATFKIGEDKRWTYEVEILKGEWCKQKEILIIRTLKEVK